MSISPAFTISLQVVPLPVTLALFLVQVTVPVVYEPIVEVVYKFIMVKTSL